MQPKLVPKPEIGANGMLRSSGFFETQPEQVNFDLMFQLIDNQWRLFGIAANTALSQPPAAPQAEAQPAPTAAAEDWPTPALVGEPTPAEVKAAVKKPSGEPQKPDVRDRVENVDSPPAPKAKAKPAESYNPFSNF